MGPYPGADHEYMSRGILDVRIPNPHGGDISVDSRPGEGCTFSIRLPLLHSEEMSASTAILPSGEKAILIIVIDNDVVSRNYCAQIMGRQGYPVVQFSSIQETATWCDAHPKTEAIALIPAVLATEAPRLTGLKGIITPVWIVENNGACPPSDFPHIRRPFPPAALIETVRETRRLRDKNKLS